MFSSTESCLASDSQHLDDIRGQFKTILGLARDAGSQVVDDQSEALRIAFILKHLRNLETSDRSR